MQLFVGTVCPFTRLSGFLGTLRYTIHLLVGNMKGNKRRFRGHLSTRDEYLWRDKAEDRNYPLINEFPQSGRSLPSSLILSSISHSMLQALEILHVFQETQGLSSAACYCMCCAFPWLPSSSSHDMILSSDKSSLYNTLPDTPMQVLASFLIQFRMK